MINKQKSHFVYNSINKSACAHNSNEVAVEYLIIISWTKTVALPRPFSPSVHPRMRVILTHPRHVRSSCSCCSLMPRNNEFTLHTHLAILIALMLF